MIYKDYYKILGLETSRVSIEEIKTAYRISAKKYHPDVNVGNELAEERIKDINEAYRVLSVPSSKRKYDRTWNAHNIRTKQKNLNSKESIFQIFLGDNLNTQSTYKEKEAINGEDIETEIDITLEEAYLGTEKKIVLKAVTGKGKAYSITVPKGIKNGAKIRLLGQGKEGKNGGKNGNLYIKINIKKNENFILKGNDLYTELLITPWEACLGARVTIRTLEEDVKIYIPEGTQSGEKVHIPNKGYSTNEGEKGDLIAEVKIIVPSELTNQERKIYEKLKEISKFNPRNIND